MQIASLLLAASLLFCSFCARPAGKGDKVDKIDAVYTDPPQKAPDLTSNAAVSRLTPEQVVGALEQALDVYYGIEDPSNGNKHHYITGHLAVPLGGVNYHLNGPVRTRDRLTKVHSLLIARSIAWPVAIKLIEREEEQPASARSLFSKCSFTDDYPSKDAESKARWLAQLQDIYMRLYSRDATAQELALHEATFTQVHAREGNTSDAWLVTFYALLSGMETWNTWR